MPISKQNMAKYPGGSIRSKEWLAIRDCVGKRSGWKCEKCKAPHRQTICRGEGDDAGTYMLETGEIFDAETGKKLGHGINEYRGRYVLVILTVAHIDGDPGNNDDGNLAHWCQLHHNRHDAKSRAVNARKTINAKIGQGELL